VDGVAIGTVGFARDVTQRRLTQDQLQLAASVFTHSREGIMITTADGTIIDVNLSFSHITGFERNDVLGKNPRILSSGRQSRETTTNLWRSLLGQGHWEGDIWNRRKNGEVYAVRQTISAVHDKHGVTQHYVALFSDITSAKNHEAELEHVAHFDALTNLPNRILLFDRMRQAMNQADRHARTLAVVFLDLDGFKSVNDNHGHEIGDQLLVSLATRMKAVLRDGDTLARMGGDEFVAILLDLPDTTTSATLVGRLLVAAAQVVPIGSLELQVSASIGVTFFPQNQVIDANGLLDQADQAMYQAKLEGKNRYHVFDDDQDKHMRAHHQRLEQIRQALKHREFVLHYQPKVNLRTQQITGVEALIRWQQADGSLQLPAVFLPVIEDHPLAIELGEWVLHEALNQLAEWHRAGLKLAISVNMGVRHLRQPLFATRLQAVLKAHPEISPADLELEMLEASALQDLPQLVHTLVACRALGVKFALDDFGTGYSSLTVLKQLPVTRVKIDQHFVQGMLDQPADLAILQGVLGLAAAFQLQVTAEGVENGELAKALLQLGCDEVQGFGIASPMPGSLLADWSKSWSVPADWSATKLLSKDDLPLLYAIADQSAGTDKDSHNTAPGSLRLSITCCRRLSPSHSTTA